MGGSSAGDGVDSGLPLTVVGDATLPGGAGLSDPRAGVDGTGTPTGFDSRSGFRGVTNSGSTPGGSSDQGVPAAADVLANVLNYATEHSDVAEVARIVEMIDGALLEESFGYRPIIIETSMLEAVRADIDSLGETKAGMPRATRALAMWLAEAIDKVGTAAGPTQVARLAAELRGVLRVLAVGEDGGEDVDRAALQRLLSTPDRGAR
jgi:hypothetical protein